MMKTTLFRNWWMPGGTFPLGAFLGPWILLLVIFELILKGIALYRAARNGQKYWFTAILILNTAGILPLIYLLFCPEGKKK